MEVGCRNQSVDAVSRSKSSWRSASAISFVAASVRLPLRYASHRTSTAKSDNEQFSILRSFNTAEPNGSRRATPPSLIQHRPGQFQAVDDFIQTPPLSEAPRQGNEAKPAKCLRGPRKIAVAGNRGHLWGEPAQNRNENKAELFAGKFGAPDERWQFFEVPLSQSCLTFREEPRCIRITLSACTVPNAGTRGRDILRPMEFDRQAGFA